MEVYVSKSKMEREHAAKPKWTPAPPCGAAINVELLLHALLCLRIPHWWVAATQCHRACQANIHGKAAMAAAVPLLPPPAPLILPPPAAPSNIPPPPTAPPVDVSNYIIGIVVGTLVFIIVVRLSIHCAHVHEWASRRSEPKPTDSRSEPKPTDLSLFATTTCRQV